MAEPTPSPDSSPRPLVPAFRVRKAALVDAGLEALSLAMLAFAAVGFTAYAGRREISRELAQAWLAEQGVEASLELDEVDASGFSGAIRLGPKSAPIFSAERIEVAYDLSAPWSGGPFALNTRAVRLVAPRLRARLDADGLNFGALQPLIDRALKSPGEPSGPGPAVLIENARVQLSTPGGLARLSGDASLDDGQLLRFDGRLAALRYAQGDKVIDTGGVLVSARKRGARLSLTADLDLRSASMPGLDLEDGTARIEADLAYPDLKRLAAVGPVQVRAAVRAGSASLGDAAIGGLEGNFALVGTLTGDLKSGGFSGRLNAHGRGASLAAPALQAAGITGDLTVGDLVLTHGPQGVTGLGRTRLQARLDKASAAGLALIRGEVDLVAPALTLTFAGPPGLSLGGPLTADARFARVATGGVALEGLTAAAQGRFALDSAGATLGLDARAQARGGATEADLDRLTSALPNPDYVTAARRALSAFAVQVPAARLTLSEGRTVVSLSQPVVLASASGARLAVRGAGGPLLQTAGGVSTGGLAATLTGGGLPDLSLEAPAWRAAGGDVSGPVSLTVAGLDVPPARGLAGTLSGPASLSSGAFSWRLAGCAPLTATQIEAGEDPLREIGLTLCPAAEPLVVVQGGRWRAAARFQDGKALITAAEARAQDVAGTFTGGGQGFDSAQVRITGGRVIDAAETRRFNPLLATGALTLADGVWRGSVNAATPTGAPLGQIALTHAVASGRGEARIDASSLSFATDGLQPADLTPLAAFATEARGPAGFTGRFAWDKSGMTSDGRVATAGLDFTSPLGFVATLKGEVAFTSLAPLTTGPGQTLKVASIQSVVPLEMIEAAFTLGAEQLRISDAAFTAAKGRVTIEPISVPLDGKGVLKGVVTVAHLDLGELLASSPLADRMQVEAVVDGRLPFEYGPQGFRFLDGQLHAIQPGRVSIAREALSSVQAATGVETPVVPVPAPTADGPVNAIQDFAYQAMENLRFDTLEAGVDSADGRLGVRFHIKGEHDPKVAEVARVGLLDLLTGKAFQKRIPLPAKTPVDLTLDTSINFDELLAAWKRRWQDESPQPPRSDEVQP